MYLEEFDIEIPNKHLFLGENQGVALIPRGPGDNHIIVVFLVEDDGNWSVSRNQVVSFSNFWIRDLMEQLQAAEQWMVTNAVKDPSGFGYCFKE